MFDVEEVDPTVLAEILKDILDNRRLTLIQPVVMVREIPPEKVGLDIRDKINTSSHARSFR